MLIVTLAIRFTLEVVGLVAWFVSVMALVGPTQPALVAPAIACAATLLFAVAWGRTVAPAATNRLSPRTRELGATGIMLGVAATLAIAGQPALATGFAAATLASHVLLLSQPADVAARAAALAARHA